MPALCFFFVVRAFAQEPSCLHRTLPLSVEDAKGFQVQGLIPADFQVKLRDTPVKILSIVPDERPHRIVILVDASGSMAEKWGRALAPASTLAESNLPNTELALLIFGTSIYEQIGFSEGHTLIARRLRQLTKDSKDATKFVHGKTALYDSLLAGLQLLGTTTSADIIYVISDGGDNASRAHVDELTRRLTASGVRLFVSLVVSEAGQRSRTPEEVQGPTDLSELVRKTGGEIIEPFGLRAYVDAKVMEQVSAALNNFHHNMLHASLLEVELPGPPDKKRNWELKPSAENRKRWKDVRIIYPEELEPCKL
jgi:VWFA-related protein